MTKRILFAIVLCCWSAVRAQTVISDSIFVLPDSARPFTLEEFYQVVLSNHPVARQASLLSEVAQQEIRLARGNFDPKLESQFLLKHYNGTEYYRLFDGAITFPTRSPVRPVVGIERNSGTYLNPENYVGQYGGKQVYTGVSIPVGQGLLTDERRTALKQAELFGDMMEAEQVKVMNKLLLEAAKDYWQWYYSYYNYRLATNTAAVGAEIFRRVKINLEGGEAAPIDTVQARITLLERQVSRQEALGDWTAQTLNISTWLWDSLANPVALSPQVAPVGESGVLILPERELEELVNFASVHHPDLRKLDAEIGQLEFDRRLASEYLKPKVDLTYYLLDQPLNPEGLTNGFEWDDNFKFGVDFSIPLFLRKERAKLGQARLKLANTTFERSLALRQIMNDVYTAHNFVRINGVLLQQQRLMVEQYYRLMNAELINFENGESDLFRINLQQEKLFQAQSKLIKVIAEYEKQKSVLYWSAGVSPASP